MAVTNKYHAHLLFKFLFGLCNMVKEVENIKTLCADIVERAKSGHPGAPLGLSQFIHILYTEYLHLNPDDPKWLHRDIFVLSNGHACVIQYLMNHLIGFLPFEELLNFRQLNSKTPGHPERNDCGIEISTGPLGQGVASSVGFAISSKILQKYGLNNRVYCIFGDGCYQEGISQEAFSLCSKLGLDNITFIYDFNKTTIDGSTKLSMCENVVDRFKSLNFDVFEIEDDAEQIREVLSIKCNRAKVVVLHTRIGKDSELEGSSKCHGNPLGAENVLKLKEKLGMPKDKFYFSEDLVSAYRTAAERMRRHANETASLNGLPETLNEIIRSVEEHRQLEYWVKYNQDYVSETLATRIHFSNALNTVSTNVQLLCGCADLTPSIKGQINGTDDLSPDHFSENSYIRYGIREHAMCGVMNGIASHGIFTPVCGTFLNFATYGMPSIRMACLDRLKTIYVFTHDSIGLGEDGPTHQPIEVLSTLRALPNLTTYRPCDGRETRSALALALLNKKGPSAIILTRQKVSEIEWTSKANEKFCSRDASDIDEYSSVEKGGYYLIKEPGHDIVLMATGSEVELAVEVKKNLKEYRVSVVSIMSLELFEEQPEEYKLTILDRKAIRVSIEALSTFGWAKYSDLQIGLDMFGRSAPYKDVFGYFGFTPEAISEKIRRFIANLRSSK
ncbi:uncharacterized protein VICG_01769 [Vittaforma corneae ATCC 50505]|uniref:transketolase n=1 Tax=Vittaforma corneae (strain ATCC 50505) TaxID=993615 RepID=L2GL11_VITCO|nr:uncharacterized protein VICG_01769 [Vittaforma corneae ATCC 50505]ELA41170.1 hypothetical protein VICG_01769 [Vittaforma corneae ATCC 50505]